LFLKEHDSDKMVYGFDTFTGFPGKSPYDNPLNFDSMYDMGLLEDTHIQDVWKLRKYRKGKPLSRSGDFSRANPTYIHNTAHLLGLDNYKLIKGPFQRTMKGDFTFLAANLDCDLYESYKIALPFVWERLIEGGYIHLDEYYSLKFPGARLACDEFKEMKPKMHRRRVGEFERWYAIKKSVHHR
jgi:hypothetical protein